MMEDAAVLEGILPEDRIRVLEKGRMEEVWQPLIDLGYLSLNNLNVSATALALQTFREEVKHLNAFFTDEIVWPPADEAMTIDPLELELLRKLTALDGDIFFNQIPKIGQRDIHSRICFYRLDLIGLLPQGQEIGHAFSKEGELALKKLVVWLQPNALNPMLDVFNRIGDIPELIQWLLKNGQLDQGVICFTAQLNKKKKTAVQQILKEESPIDALSDIEKNKINTIPIVRTRGLVARDQDVERLQIVENHIQSLLDELKVIQEESLSRSVSLSTHLHQEQQFVNQLENKLEKKEETLLRKKHQIHSVARLSKEVTPLQKDIQKLSQNREQNLPAIKLKLEQLKEIQDLINQKPLLEVERENLKNEIKNLKKDIREKSKNIRKLEKQINHPSQPRNDDVAQKQLEIQEEVAQLRSIREKLLGFKSKFKKNLKESLTPAAYRKTEEMILDVKQGNMSSFNMISADKYNHFLMRVLQVYCWMNGYYQGKLDSDFGDRTLDAVLDICEDIKKLNKKHILKNIGTKNNQYYILNVHYFFKKVIEADEEQEGIVAAGDHPQWSFSNFVEQHEAELNELHHRKLASMDEAWTVYTDEIKIDITLGRKIYQGARSLVRSLFRGVRRLFKIIAQGIRKVLTFVRENVLPFLKNFVKFLYREMREGWHKFGTGMKFLFGRRQFKTTDPDSGLMVMSGYDFDFDTTLFIPEGISLNIVSSHIEKVNYHASSLNFSLTLIGKVVHWAITIAWNFTWAGLLLRLALYFKKLVLKWLLKPKKIIRAVVKIVR